MDGKGQIYRVIGKQLLAWWEGSSFWEAAAAGAAGRPSCYGWQRASTYRMIGKQLNTAMTGTVGSQQQLLGSGGSGGCGKAELLWVAKG